MNNIRFDRVCAGVIFGLAACLAQTAYAGSVRSAIDAVNAEFSANAAKGDGAGIAALYSKDAQVMPAGTDPIRGREAIQKFLQGALDSGVAVMTLKTIEVFSQGSTATEVGHYELGDKSGKTIDQGTYMVVWRHEDGKWRLFRDIFASSVPPPKK